MEAGRAVIRRETLHEVRLGKRPAGDSTGGWIVTEREQDLTKRLLSVLARHLGQQVAGPRTNLRHRSRIMLAAWGHRATR